LSRKQAYRRIALTRLKLTSILRLGRLWRHVAQSGHSAAFGATSGVWHLPLAGLRYRLAVQRLILLGQRNLEMAVHVIAVGRHDVPQLSMPERFRHEVSYFMTAPDGVGVPSLGANEYWIQLAEAEQWLDDGVFRLISPLDSANRTEIELSEEQETWLEWIVKHRIEHIRLE
jgi:hypothetical protein